MRRTKPKKLADAAGRLGSAKENYRTPESYVNSIRLSSLFYKPRRTHRRQYPLLKNQTHFF